MNVLDLFSCIGGFSLGLERADFETVAFCEINPFCRAVLKKHWPDVPCFNDVRALSAETVAAHGIASIDVICGGYPCQPFSAAGKRRGQADDRHLWPEMFRLIRELRPAWVIGESVAGHVTMGLDDVLDDLENEGYTARAFIIPACAVDAPHRRDRVWVVANSGRQRREEPGAGVMERSWRTELSGQAYLWPTPTTDSSDRSKPYSQGGTPLSLAIKLWRTPNASDGDKWSNQSLEDRMARGQQIRLNTQVSPEGGKGGLLNPTWVEWLMGYPIGWTALNPSETDSYLKSRKQLARSLRQSKKA